MQVTKNALSGLVRTSPMFLLVAMILSFLLMFLVQLFYYSNLFNGFLPVAFCYIVAVGIGLMVQLSRLALGLAGASEFMQGNTGKGIAGILFSLALSIFEAFEVYEIVSSFDEKIRYSMMMVLQSIVWLGFILEIRLAINLKSSKKETITFKKSTSKNGRVQLAE